jgi:signal transduction histidine kinase
VGAGTLGAPVAAMTLVLGPQPHVLTLVMRVLELMGNFHSASMCCQIWHVRNLTARLDMQFRVRLSERMRIAQELHDTLFQEVQSASMQPSVE